MTEAAPEKKDVVPGEYRERYKATGGTNGDFIATELQRIGKDGVESLQAVMAENGVDKSKWAGFNPGMQRMNLANVLRGSYLKGETIKLLGKEYNAKHQAEDYTGEVKDNDKSLKALAAYLSLNDNERTVKALRKLWFEPTAEEKAAAKAKAKEEREAARAEAKAAKEAERAEAKAKREKEKADAKAKKDADKAAKKAEADKAKAAKAAE